MKDNLKYLSQKSIADLYDKVEDNLENYTNGDFTDLAAVGGWDTTNRWHTSIHYSLVTG